MIAGPALDGDALVVEVRKIDRDVGPGMGAGGDQPAVETDGAKGGGQHLRVGDVVVEHVHALAAGEPQHFGREVAGSVVDAVIGAEVDARLDAVVGTGGRDDSGADHVLGDLDADRAEIAAGAHDQHGLAGFELGDVEQQVPCRRDVAHDHGRLVEVESVRNCDGGAGRHRNQLGKAARPLDAHHAGRTAVALVVLGTDLERHHAGGCDPHSLSPAPDPGPDRIDDPGTIDPRDERKRGSARALLAGAQAHVEHAIDRGCMDADADLALAWFRVRDILIFEHVRRPVFVDDDRFHASPCLSACELSGCGDADPGTRRVRTSAALQAALSPGPVHQSILTPASRTMRSHLAASALTRSANADAVMTAGSTKLAASRSHI